MLPHKREGWSNFLLCKKPNRLLVGVVGMYYGQNIRYDGTVYKGERISKQCLPAMFLQYDFRLLLVTTITTSRTTVDAATKYSEPLLTMQMNAYIFYFINKKKVYIKTICDLFIPIFSIYLL